MAYQAKRVQAYTQDFELVEADGTVVHSMKVALDPGSMIEKLSKQYTELLKVQREVMQIDTNAANHVLLRDAYEKLGKAVIAMIRSVFGDEQTEVILEFYSNRYNDIVLEVVPFIANIVIPEMRRITHENKKNILQKYNRKARRSMMKGNNGVPNRQSR